ncbi:hypothetical protein GGF46_003799 [Coemansia sp. RSA 552]|nr:hypothetical protein GGF46_003799 [Coemansia sp. RSA 552]
MSQEGNSQQPQERPPPPPPGLRQKQNQPPPRAILPNRAVEVHDKGSIYEQMLERKREKNKLAARRKRERKKQRLEDLETRKAELEQRRLTLRAELRARRRMNWLIISRREGRSAEETESQMPSFTLSDSSDLSSSGELPSSDDAVVLTGPVASTSAPPRRPLAVVQREEDYFETPRTLEDDESELGLELDKLRDDVQAACTQTMGTIELLNEIRSEISHLVDNGKQKPEPRRGSEEDLP